MDNLAESLATILTIVTTVTGAIIATISLIKALKSETRTKLRLDKNTEDIKITREGIVQGFKEAIVTKDLKVSINKQVEKVIDNKLEEFIKIVSKNEGIRTRLTYWTLKTLEYTAAFDKFTNEEKAEIYELLAMIADEEQIVETLD